MEKILTDMAVKLNMAMFNFVNDLKTIEKQYWRPIVDEYECQVTKIIATTTNDLIKREEKNVKRKNK